LVCAWSKFKTEMAWEVKHHNHLMGEEVASSTPHASRHPPSRVAACGMTQRAAEHASVALSQPAPNGPLAAARELLRNPPDEAASPNMLRQWRDDVNRLFNLAQATPGSVGDLCPASIVVRAAHPDLCSPCQYRVHEPKTCGQNSTADVRERMPVSPSSGLVRAGSTLRVGTLGSSSTRLWQSCRNLPRPRWPGWAAQRSRTTFGQWPSRLSFGRTCRKRTMDQPTHRNSYRSTSPPWQVTFM
jgi:hypothetical protein